MNKNYIFLCLLLLTMLTFSCTQRPVPEPRIVPQPHQMQLLDGGFQLSEKTLIIVSDDELMPLAELFNSYLERISGLKLNILKGNETHEGILFKLDAGLTEEEYRLEVGDKITLNASDYKDMALGLSSLVQMLDVSSSKVIVRKLSVSDKPDVSYRSVMLDLARFWHPVETIKETIDLLWLYKIPFLHVHLSDNRRFTFPMDDFPDLKTVNKGGSREYYTRAELDDLVEYAKQRGIVIIPEIDLPAHSAQLNKYPEVFGTFDEKTGKARNIGVINIAKESAYEGTRKIINSLAEVFYTSPYIHIGGDESWLEGLKKVPEYKSFCKKHNFTEALKGNAGELFCYFISQLNEMVKATGKKSLIWEGYQGTGEMSLS